MIARLSSPLGELRDHYTVVVVGSGYGGAIAASRLARAGQQVCLLERGREILPGEYPDTRFEAAREFQVDTAVGQVGSRTALFDFRGNRDMNVIVGCGLGGTSLINANVSLSAERRVFDDPRWPEALRGDLETLLAEGYARAQAMLRPAPYPADAPTLLKLASLELSAARMGARFYRPPINVTYEDGQNHVGVDQRGCVLCGDCVSGCNYGAKNTVLMNYLPDAKAHGAEIFTQVGVRRVERDGGGWRVHFQALETGREPLDAPTRSVGADIVILAAGALGSPEILLRSKAAGLPLSERVGDAFTGNGDVLGFAYNNDVAQNAIGFGSAPPDGREPVGPCITGIIDLREQEQLDDGIVVEEGVIPGAIADLLPAPFAAAARLVGKDTDAGVADMVAEMGRELESLVRGPYHGATRHTQTYLVMSHDDGRGRLYLEDDRLRIDWPGVGSQPVFELVDGKLEEATRPLGGTYLRNPLWTRLTRHDLVTVHPLGGCVMAEDAEHGVVNDRGEVFAGASGAATHEGLYVSDGSVIPRPLGVNPLLTISAITERCCALLAQSRGWQIDYRFGERLAPRPEPRRLGLQLTERMAGHLSTAVALGFEEAARDGRDNGFPIELTVTIVADDLERFVAAEGYEATLLGTATIPGLSASPLTVEDGAFRLLVPDAERPGARRTGYSMRLRSVEGAVYRLEGFKAMHDEPGLDSWADLTTLYMTLHESDADPPMSKGVATISPLEFMRSLRSVEVTNAATLEERLSATANFGRFVAGPFFEVYGGVFGRPTDVRPAAPPRKKRALRAAAPTIHEVAVADGTRVLLTRYRGGEKGPVLVAHGVGVSSGIFAADTLDTSLLEFVYANGFDVWLLDWRASTNLPSTTADFTLDDVARGDWPAAVRAVGALTGSETVQVVAHCAGSIAFLMAALAGLEGVRSAVSLQGGTHLVLAAGSPIGDGARMRELTGAQGDRAGGVWEQIGDPWPAAAGPACGKLVCRRIGYMYGRLYDHGALDPATHDALHEQFGFASPALLDHLGTIAEAGHVVDAGGGDAYLPHVERLAFPITFIHGTANETFLPESTERTLRLLRERNGADLYARHLVPGYGHVDALIGKDAVTAIYPLVVDHLERT